MAELVIDGERMLRRLDELGRLGADDRGGRSRLALTDADKAARDLVVEWMELAGARVYVDPIGNIVGVLPGLSTKGTVMMGSHIDTVVRAGALDGCYGVIGGIEVLSAFTVAGVRPEVSLAVAVFTNEEGVRFTPDLMGSRVMAGRLALDEALAARDCAGRTVHDELERIGYCGTPLPAELQPHCFLELHIEQGPVLESEGLAAGIVDAVQGHSWWRITVEGTANHAGTTPMLLRHDAGAAAMSVATEIIQAARFQGTPNVATVGSIALEPGAINVVPGRATFTLDLRDHRSEVLRRAEEQLLEAIGRLERQGFAATSHCISRAEPVGFDAQVCRVLDGVAADLELAARRIVSGASHDAQMLAVSCPSAMLFVPSRGGISHNPAEHTAPEQLVQGAHLLLRAILKLAAICGGSDVRLAV